MPITDIVAQAKEGEAALRTQLAELGQITPDSLRRNNELGPFNFSPGLEIFNLTLRLFGTLADANLDNVPVQTLAALKASAENALARFRAILAFDPSTIANPMQQRDALIESIASDYPGQFGLISPVIAYSVRKGTDFEKLEQAARVSADGIAQLEHEVLTQVAKIRAEANAGLESVRQVLLEAGVSQHNIHFKEEAEKHRKARGVWLGITAALGIALVIAGWAMVAHYLDGKFNITTPQAIQLAVAKLVLFGALYFAVVWASRVYRAESHNLVVNRHRQNALSTFEAFVKAASDEQTKNAVLLQATHSIFQHQVSGFATHESDGPTSPQVLEIIRSMAPPKTS